MGSVANSSNQSTLQSSNVAMENPPVIQFSSIFSAINAINLHLDPFSSGTLQLATNLIKTYWTWIKNGSYQASNVCLQGLQVVLLVSSSSWAPEPADPWHRLRDLGYGRLAHWTKQDQDFMGFMWEFMLCKLDEIGSGKSAFLEPSDPNSGFQWGPRPNN